MEAKVSSGREALKRIRYFLAELVLYICNHWVASIPILSFRDVFYRWVMGFKIHPTSCVHLGAFFYASRGFQMGRESVVNKRCLLDTRGGITIGDYVALAMDVKIITADHDVHTARLLGRQRPVTIEDYAFIGTGAMILPGVTVGRASCVAAGAVVTKNVGPFEIVAGIPAKVVGHRIEPSDDYTAEYRRLFH